MAYIDGPCCVLIFCGHCNAIVDKSIRGRKTTCSDECATLYQQDVWRRQYAQKMDKDPEYAKKSSAKQWARIKADPEKLAVHKEKQRERLKLPNYQEAQAKSLKKYRADPDNKRKIAQRMRRYRDQNPEIIAQVEERRISKRSQERLHLKLHHPEQYEQLRLKERLAEAQRKAERRLSELHKNLGDLHE